MSESREIILVPVDERKPHSKPMSKKKPKAKAQATKARPPRLLLRDNNKQKIIDWIGTGMQSRQQCAEMLGCDHTTIIREMRLDPKFKADILAAENSCKIGLVQKMYNHPDWRAAHKLLCVKYPAEFASDPNMWTQEEMIMLMGRLMAIVNKFVPDERQADMAEAIQEEAKKFSSERKTRQIRALKSER